MNVLLNDFQNGVEKLNPKDDEYAFELRTLVMRLVSDVAVLIGDYQHGEIPALLHLCHGVLVALSAETDLDVDTEEVDRRRCRYRTQQAVLNLLVFCDTVAEHHAGPKFDRRRNVEALKASVADALGDLVSDD